MNPEIIVNHDLTFAEFLKTNFYLTIRMRLIRRLLLFSVIVGVLGFFSNTLLSPKPTTNWYTPVLSFLIVPLFFISFFGLWTLILSLIIYNTKRRYFKGVTYRFTHWGLEKTGKGIEASTPWKKIIKVKENKNFFFLFVTANDAHIVQKKNFSDEFQIKEFRALLENSLH